MHAYVPIEASVRLSTRYEWIAEREKERAKDLIAVAEQARAITVDLLGIAAAQNDNITLLTATNGAGIVI